MSALPPLNALRAFEAAARTGAFNRAAAELSVTPAAVSQQVRQLEAFMQVSLFEREGRGLRLTEAGRTGLERLSRAFELIGDVAAGWRSGPPDAALSIAVEDGPARRWFARRLDALGAHASLTLTLFRADEAEAGNAAIHVRYGSAAGAGEDILARAPESVAPVAAPDLAMAIRSPDDLANAPLIHDRSAETDGWTWRRWLTSAGVFDVSAMTGTSCADSAWAASAARAGRGVLLARRSLVSDAIAAGRLRLLFPDGDRRSDADYIIARRTAEPLHAMAEAFIGELVRDAAREREGADEL